MDKRPRRGTKTSIYLPTEVMQALQVEARLRDRSVSWLLASMAQEWLRINARRDRDVSLASDSPEGGVRR